MLASALSFHLLFSLLPSLAIILAILSGSTFKSSREKLIDHIVDGIVPSQLGEPEPEPDGPIPPGANAATYWKETGVVGHERQDIVKQIKMDLRRVINVLSSNLGKVSILSFLILLYVASNLFNTIEQTFNAIWNVRVGRPFFSRIAVTTAIIFWGPVILALSFAIVAKLPQWNFLNAYCVPVLFTTIAFTAFYMIMPFARVRFRDAAVGGFAAAIAWELTKVGFLYYVKFAVGQSALYGSLSMVPIVFLWVYLTWMVVLGGAETAYVVQHRNAMVSNWISRQRDKRSRTEAWDAVSREAALLPYLAVAAAFEIAKRFRSGKDAGDTSLSELAETLGEETGTLERALQRLTSAEILAVVAPKSGDEEVSNACYLPAKDLANIPLNDLVRACHGSAPEKDGASWTQARDLIQTFRKDGWQTLEGKSLANLSPAPAPSLNPNSINSSDSISELESVESPSEKKPAPESNSEKSDQPFADHEKFENQGPQDVEKGKLLPKGS